LVNLALFFAGQGQGDRTAALLGPVIRHPATEQDIEEKAQRLLDKLGLVPPEGESKPLEEVAAEVLAELQVSVDCCWIAQARYCFRLNGMV
jgi:hypothetical protein